MGKDALDAVARLCRAYVAFLESPTEDSLFNWSNALHSMHDRVPEGMRDDLFKLNEFVAMKALRNHFHHGGEVPHVVKPLPIGEPLESELRILCLIDRAAAEAAIEGIEMRYQAREQPMARQAMKWYATCVNLYPAIFNLMVHVVLLAQKHDVTPDDEAFKRLEERVEFDKASGYSVTVTGELLCHAGSVDTVLAGLLAR